MNETVNPMPLVLGGKWKFGTIFFQDETINRADPDTIFLLGVELVDFA